MPAMPRRPTNRLYGKAQSSPTTSISTYMYTVMAFRCWNAVTKNIPVYCKSHWGQDGESQPTHMQLMQFIQYNQDVWGDKTRVLGLPCGLHIWPAQLLGQS